MKKTFFTLVFSFAVFMLFLHAAAYAALAGNLGGGVANHEFFTNSAKIMDNTLSNTEQIVYGLAGLGVIALATLAFFGQFKWTTFFMIVGGLVIVAGAPDIIKYVAGYDISKAIVIK